LFVGDKGMILSNYDKHVLLPEKDFAGFERPAPTSYALPATTPNGSRMQGGKTPSADFQYSGWLTEANHLGNVAYRVGKKLTWDAAKLRATNAPEADAYLHREYRKGWEL